MLKNMILSLCAILALLGVFAFLNAQNSSIEEYEEPASRAAGIYVDQSDHLINGEQDHDTHENEEHESEDDHEGHDHE